LTDSTTSLYSFCRIIGKYTRFFTTSGVPLVESNQFHVRHTEFSSQSKSRVGNVLTKDTFKYSLNIDGPRLPGHPVCMRCLDPSVSTFSLSLHRHPYICILFICHLISYNKQKSIPVPLLGYTPPRSTKRVSLLDPPVLDLILSS